MTNPQFDKETTALLVIDPWLRSAAVGWRQNGVDGELTRSDHTHLTSANGRGRVTCVFIKNQVVRVLFQLGLAWPAVRSFV